MLSKLPMKFKNHCLSYVLIFNVIILHFYFGQYKIYADILLPLITGICIRTARIRLRRWVLFFMGNFDGIFFVIWYNTFQHTFI